MGAKKPAACGQDQLNTEAFAMASETKATLDAYMKHNDRSIDDIKASVTHLVDSADENNKDLHKRINSINSNMTTGFTASAKQIEDVGKNINSTFVKVLVAVVIALAIGYITTN